MMDRRSSSCWTVQLDLSGNVVAVLVKPIELFVVAVLALVLLSLTTKFALTAHTTRFQVHLTGAYSGTGCLL